MATTMLAAGVPVPVVSEQLCHARTSTTVNICAHAMHGADPTPPTSSPTSSARTMPKRIGRSDHRL